MADAQDLVQYLSSKGIRTFRAAGKEVTAHCWFCPDGDPKGKGRLYLNTESWLWDCKRCMEHGNRKTLLRHFGDQDDAAPAYLPGQDPAMRRKVLSDATALGEDMLYANPQVLRYLEGRGFTPQTIVEARLGYAPNSWSLAGELKAMGHIAADLRSAGIINATGQEFFSGHILFPYTSHGDVVQLRGKQIGGPTITPAGDHSRLYGADDLHGARDAIVVEGEPDRLMLKQTLASCPDAALRQTAVVGLPGAGSAPDGFASYFEDCRRVYLGFDPDQAGKTAAAKYKELIGTKARIIELPEDLPKCDWNDFLLPKDPTKVHSGHSWRDVRDLMEKADSVGRTLFTVRDAHREWHRIETQVGGVKTGFRIFDQIISPGLKPGQLLVPIARTGVGKSQFLTNLVWNLRARPQLVISLEQSAPEFYSRMRMLAHFWHPMWSDDEINESLELLRIVDRRMKPGELLRYADEFYDDVGQGPQVVHVDYIGYYSQSCQGANQYERTTKAVIGLKEDSKAGGFVMDAPHQAGRTAAAGVPVGLEDARDSGAIEDTADVMVGLWRPSDADSTVGPNGTVQLKTLKNRNGRKGQVISLNASFASLAMVEAGTPESRVVDDENAVILRGGTYRDVQQMRQGNNQIVGQQMLRIAR